MTDNPPAVPGELIEKAAKAVAQIFWEGRPTNDDREYAEAVPAASLSATHADPTPVPRIPRTDGAQNAVQRVGCPCGRTDEHGPHDE